MESRIIYESDKTYLNGIHWIKPKIDSQTEWLYLNPENIAEKDFEKIFDSNFNCEKLYFVINRSESKEVNQSEAYTEIKLLYGQIKFRVWNENFESVVEFDNEVYRKGTKPAGNSSL
ncbi:hypothetical protein [Flavobacterium sp. UBA7682]|uniref:hypothetical protein n=1 Tax=Flavobacterium sp. UBA7682 TaxID=1946560 RepID=UPI0025C3376B|nr:hypothetical protein [Flavobacterium sp. UBA7682]